MKPVEVSLEQVLLARENRAGRQQRPQLRRKAPHAPAEEMPLPPEIRPQIHRHIAPGGLSDGAGRRRVDDLRARHGIALAQALRLEDPLQPRGAFLPLAENFRRLQGQIGSQSAHDLCPPPLSFHKILCLWNSFPQGKENMQKIRAKMKKALAIFGERC